MIEIAYLREKEMLGLLPEEVINAVEGALQILDSEFGVDMDKYVDDGGYVIVVEKEEDFEKIKESAYIDCDDVIPEFVDKII